MRERLFVSKAAILTLHRGRDDFQIQKCQSWRWHHATGATYQDYISEFPAPMTRAATHYKICSPRLIWVVYPAKVSNWQVRAENPSLAQRGA